MSLMPAYYYFLAKYNELKEDANLKRITSGHYRIYIQRGPEKSLLLKFQTFANSVESNFARIDFKDESNWIVYKTKKNGMPITTIEIPKDKDLIELKDKSPVENKIYEALYAIVFDDE